MNARTLLIAATAFLSNSEMQLAAAGGDDAYQNAKSNFESGQKSEAAKWLKIAVSQGHQAAQLPLAAMYRDGIGVEKNLSRALTLFTTASKQGYPSAQFSLGAMYRLGHGVERDYSEALKWYRMAAKQGDSESQNSLGVMYESGRGTAADLIKAYMWYEIAAVNGNRRGNNNRRRLGRKLSTLDTPKAKKFSITCLASNYQVCG